MTKEHVIILHGIARTSRHMKPVAGFLEKSGYIVHNLDYPSTKLPLESLAPHITDMIKSRIDETQDIVHFVGYSMGGLLLRIILKNYRPANMGRVVQLAPPNCGSQVADFLVRSKALNIFFKAFFGPAGQQLVTNQEAFRHLFGPVDFDLGVVAGIGCIDPVSYFILPHPHDGKVCVACTKTKGMKDHTTVKGSHFLFPGNKAVHRETLHFLQNGCFIADK